MLLGFGPAEQAFGEEDSSQELTLNLADTYSKGIDPAIRYSASTNEQYASKMILDPQETADVKRWNDQGFQALQEGDPKRSLSYFKEAYKLNKKSSRARFGIGTAFISLGRYKDALKVFDPMLDEYPYDFLLRNNVAWLLATANDATVRNPRRARQLAQDAVLVGFKDYHVWSTLSETHYAMGDYERAHRTAIQALDMATEAGAPAASREDYRRQVDKCAKAVEAFSIME
ncbi:MAG: hypothetical protein A2X46_03470 [Lentisphaerae bacterium GWF2_57_35]|nr:MAG: hypothetical protein A2X46_03470 [Lentisphaerae bacterium GWF2_57_35]